jgi:hypothetical protein
MQSLSDTQGAAQLDASQILERGRAIGTGVAVRKFFDSWISETTSGSMPIELARAARNLSGDLPSDLQELMRQDRDQARRKR